MTAYRHAPARPPTSPRGGLVTAGLLATCAVLAAAPARAQAPEAQVRTAEGDAAEGAPAGGPAPDAAAGGDAPTPPGGDPDRLPGAPAGPLRAVRVRVVDVAGGHVYVEPGRGGGLIPGVRVRIGDAELVVVRATAAYAALQARGPYPEVGTRGRARVPTTLPTEDDARRLPEPPPLASFAHQWTEPVRPADTQDPEAVPLGRVDVRDRDLRADLLLGGYAALPLEDGTGIGMGELRGRLHWAPVAGVPFTVDVDASARFWVAPDLDQRASGASRPNLYVRELALRYGDVDAFSVEAGRLRHAASLLGPIDGGRVETPRMAGFQVAAFGGGVPDPRSGVPAFDASRFGLEASYRDDESNLRPSATLVAHGSVYGGRIDERRLAAEVALFPGDFRVGGYAELSVHDADNPWGVDPVELSAASVDGAVRVGPVDVSARFDLRRPERSRWLAANLPPGYLCAIDQAQADGSGACVAADDARYLGSVDVGLRLADRWMARAGGQVIHYPVDDDLSQFGGYGEVTGSGLLGAGRVLLRAESWSAHLVTRHGGRLGLGWSFIPGVLDVGARYRLFTQLYRAEIDRTLEHAVGVDLVVSPTVDLDITLDAELFTGVDADLVLVQLLAAWRL